jgi:transposase InsO family protein
LTPRSTWQNPYVERVIGSIRCECLDHVVVINEQQLRRVLTSYVDYYHHSRTHLSLDKDCPDARTIQPSDRGKVIAILRVGGNSITSATKVSPPNPLSKAAQSPTLAHVWPAMQSRAKST